MNCLSQRQLARLALGLADDAELAMHLEQCAACRAGLEAMQTLRHELAEAHAKFDQGHEETREQLLTLLPAANRPPEPARPWNQLSHWMGGFTMRQRIGVALSGVGVAAVIGLLLFWGGIAARPVSAMEQMAERIRQAKSYKCTSVGKVLFKLGVAGKAVEKTRETMMTSYWLAPDSLRLDITYPSEWKGPGPEKSNIVRGLNKPWISINNQAKTFLKHPPRKDAAEEAALSLEKLGMYSGKADRELGTKEINGKKARGFVLSFKRINPHSPSVGLLEIWLDNETNLPIFVRSEVETEDMSATSESTCIQWDIDLDPKLFDPTPPPGYRDITPKPTPLEEQGCQITAALRIYAEASGGHYPQAQHVGLKDLGELLEKLGILRIKTEHGVKTSQMTLSNQNMAGKLSEALEGFRLLETTDHVFYGKTVGPKDKDKVLLRWKLDDGRYEVIFGDLRAETVTAEKLRTLEGKSMTGPRATAE